VAPLDCPLLGINDYLVQYDIGVTLLQLEAETHVTRLRLVLEPIVGAVLAFLGKEPIVALAR
jgi:hypothetical protein